VREPLRQPREQQDADAPTPIWPYVGDTPMTMLPTAAVPTDRVIAVRRPLRSPTQPNTNPPKGRARKPTANTASVDSTADTGSPSSKNRPAKKVAKIA
jgi:hypothetical protein